MVPVFAITATHFFTAIAQLQAPCQPTTAALTWLMALNSVTAGHQKTPKAKLRTTAATAALWQLSQSKDLQDNDRDNGL